MQQNDAHVRAMLAVYGDRALARARQIDESNCASNSPLCGVPIAVKANLCDEKVRELAYDVQRQVRCYWYHCADPPPPNWTCGRHVAMPDPLCSTHSGHR